MGRRGVDSFCGVSGSGGRAFVLVRVSLRDQVPEDPYINGTRTLEVNLMDARLYGTYSMERFDAEFNRRNHVL